jgi:hypothetical protein
MIYGKWNSHKRIRCLVTFLVLASVGVWGQPTVSVISAAPIGSIVPGQSVTMGVTATGSQLGYQWMLNGANLPGAVAATYALNMVGAADRGVYQVHVTGSGGAVTMDMGTLVVSTSDAKIASLSGRANVGIGSNVMIIGFVSKGDANSTNKNILLRGMGPALTRMGGMMMSGLLANPLLTVYDNQSRPMVSNRGWMHAPAPTTGSSASPVLANPRSATMDMMTTLGAFAPLNGSTDSALLMTPPLGLCTAILSDANSASGVGLVECYDADSVMNNGANSARLIAVSARSSVGLDTNILIAGFVIADGPSHLPETVVIRAMGPGLTPLGVSGALARPTMTLYDNNSKPIASNSGWGTAPVIATGSGASPVQAGIGMASMSVMNGAGMLPFSAGSADCALVATLTPGLYSVVVSGMPDSTNQPTTGVCSVEVYELR